MPDRHEQARAYLREAETTLRSARVLLEDDPDSFAPQVVKNAFDGAFLLLAGCAAVAMLSGLALAGE